MNADKKKHVFENRRAVISSLCIIGLALLVRLLLIPFSNYDMEGYSLWYDYIVEKGIFHSLGQNFWIYTPPYLYLLSLATLMKAWLPKILAIKLIPICFDFINAAIIYKILRLKHHVGNVPLWGTFAFLMAPTVIMNSALWGQIDSLYTCFLLVSVYLLLIRRPMPSLISFGFAFAVKAQAAFLVPFLILMGLKKRIRWYAYGLIPLAYLIAMLPAIMAGRTVVDVSTVYLKQATELQIPSFNAPNLYIFVPQSTYSISTPIGMVIGAMLISIGIYVYSKRHFVLNLEAVLLTAFISLAIMPFLLPKMHDRYFYPADVFSLVLAFVVPQFWFLPLCYQVISSLVYSIFLFDAPRSTVLILATELNTIVIGFLLWKNFGLLKSSEDLQEHITAV